MRTADFFLDKVGAPDGMLSMEGWLSVPEQGLAEATNGCLFFDRYGEVSAIRERLRCYPENIRLKRLCGNLLLMAQAGEYNYARCLAHGEQAAAQLALYEYVESAVSAVFLLNQKYKPFYKWCFRAMRSLARLGDLEENMASLLYSRNDGEMPQRKLATIREINRKLIGILRDDKLTKADTDDLEAHAYSVNDRITDPAIRNMHILAAV